MNRRAFLATTLAAIFGPRQAPFVPTPWTGIDLASKPDKTGIVIHYSSNDVEYIETRKFQVEEIARLFNVPVSVLWGRESNFAAVERKSLAYVRTVLPTMKRPKIRL